MDQIEVIASIGRIIEESKSENVFFLGDLINSFSDSLPKTVYNAVWYFIKTLSERANTYIIAGNHDIYRSMHILDPYRDMERVNIVISPVNLEIEGHSIDLIPWGYELPSIKDRGEILMSHMEVKGAAMNAAGIRTTSGTSPTALEGYKYVFLGHYHEAQILSVPHAKWAGYIGSVMQIDLSSSPYHKGVVILNEHGEIEQIDVPSPKIYSRVLVTQEQVLETTELIEKGDYWRLTITDPDIRLPSFDHRVQVEYDIKPKTEYRLEEKVGEDLKETVDRFIDTVDTKIDKELAKKLVDGVML